MIKQRPSSCAHLPSPFRSPNLLPSLSVAVKFLSSSVRNFGIYTSTCVELHIKNVCQTLGYSELRCISTIRHLLSVDCTKTLVRSRLDYCNSLLSGWPKHLEKLQKVQNSAARLVLKAHKRDRVSPLLRTLHWLPIQARTEYKL